MTRECRTVLKVPPLVAQAEALAREAGFPLTRAEAGPGNPSACLPGVGRLLAVLAAGCHGGRIGEIGTGIGVGSAWLASAMPRDCLLVTVELDQDRAAQAARLLAGDGRVRVLTGDGYDIMQQNSPLDLLFTDAGEPDMARYAALVDLLRVGGQLVMDDVIPLAAEPAEPAEPAGPEPEAAGPDLKREFFFGEPRLLSTEIVLPDLRNSLLIGTRLN